MYLVIYVKNREPFVMGSFDTEEKAKKAMTDDFK